MSVHNLDKIFRPDSIAIIGAGEKSGSIGAALMRNLIQGGFTGEIYPINPKHGEIMKMPAYPSVKDIKAPVDLGIITAPITSAPQIVKECAEADVGGVVIISAGGKEIGEAGKNVEAAIQQPRTPVRLPVKTPFMMLRLSAPVYFVSKPLKCSLIVRNCLQNSPNRQNPDWPLSPMPAVRG